MALLEIENLKFKYSGTEKNILNGLSLSVNEGEIILLCGGSGCGKTTLLRLLKREISPIGELSGNLLFDGRPTKDMSDREGVALIGYVAQSPDEQAVTDTVYKELAFGLESLGLDSGVIRRLVAEICGFFGISELYNKKISELSGGQKQLVNLASVMVMNPKLLLLDEPTSRLDPISADAFLTMLEKINRELGVTVIIAEHRLERLFSLADRVAVMKNGGFECVLPPRESATFIASDISYPLYYGLPASVKVFSALGGNGVCPVSVIEGRRFIMGNYKNTVSRLEEKSVAENENKVAIKAKNIYFSYNKEQIGVIFGLDLEVREGEIFSVLGENGAGKSTLCKILCGLLTPQRGKVELFGKNIKKGANGVALLPQECGAVFIKDSVISDLIQTASIFGYKKEDAEKRISGLAERLGITEKLDSHPCDLSGGELQKAAILKLLLLEPRVLLLDEPTKGLDPASKIKLAEILSALKKEGKTVLLVTHDIDFASEYSDRCALIFDGKSVSCEGARNFFSDNAFYTTAYAKMTRGYYENAYLLQDVVKLCSCEENQK